MIKEWLAEYQPKNWDEADQALREIIQEITLAGLYRSGFFEKAAFYGGTALRIFHGLERFSEDLDFSLLNVNPDFSLEPYLQSTVRELAALGVKVSIQDKEKINNSKIDSAFLKADTVWKELVIQSIMKQESLNSRKGIKIKIEIDTKPPLGFSTEEKLLIRPFSFYTKCFTLSDLFAGKMHALLFRKWGNRVKGRDWFDMEWFIRKNVPLHLNHFRIRAMDSGDWSNEPLDRENLFQLLTEKIDQVSFDLVRKDVTPFIKDDSSLKIWSSQYFKDLIRLIKTV
jgi:predicted nucleotidyltransferase component of viral defense system